jgi:hypothetical protein
MTDPQVIKIRSTSATTASVTPILLRGGEQTRLVFIPTLIDNDDNQAAAVRGTFIYQRKQQNKAWEDVQAINLSSLHSDEGVRLELKSNELLEFYKCLGAVYRYYEEVGIEHGDNRCILVNARSPTHKVLDVLQSTPNASSVLAVIEWVNSQDPSLVAEHFRSRQETLLKLDNTLGVARLQSFIERAESLFASSYEDDWQEFLKQESLAIGQIYAEPVVVIRDQPYVGGKGIDNRGGSVADFLYRNELSDNCILVEIKTPTAPLVVKDHAARNHVLNASPALTGGMQQLLQDRYTLAQNYRSIVGDDIPQFRIFSPRLLLIIGTFASLTDNDMRRSFEFFRGSQRDVSIVAFDELVKKAKQLLTLLRSTA